MDKFLYLEGEFRTSWSFLTFATIKRSPCDVGCFILHAWNLQTLTIDSNTNNERIALPSSSHNLLYLQRHHTHDATKGLQDVDEIIKKGFDRLLDKNLNFLKTFIVLEYLKCVYVTSCTCSDRVIKNYFQLFT